MSDAFSSQQYPTSPFGSLYNPAIYKATAPKTNAAPPKKAPATFLTAAAVWEATVGVAEVDEVPVVLTVLVEVVLPLPATTPAAPVLLAALVLETLVTPMAAVVEFKAGFVAAAATAADLLDAMDATAEEMVALV